MNCPQCGTHVQRDSLYCHRCGLRLDGESPAASRSARDRAGRAGRGVELPPPEGEDTEERELWRGTFSAKAMANAWVAATILTIAVPAIGLLVGMERNLWLLVLALLALAWLLLFGTPLYRQLSVSYLLTSHRFVLRIGLLNRDTRRLEVLDIDDVTYRQGIVERLLGVGTLVIHSSDRTDPVLVMPGIDGVQAIASVIDDARRAERMRRGLHIEAI